MLASSRLRDTYAPSPKLCLRAYLAMDFKGRQIITKLRVDDLELDAAGFKGCGQMMEKCRLCGDSPETRMHFVVACSALAQVRQRHQQAILLAQGLNQADAFKTFILARPREATESSHRAELVGAMLFDMWAYRSQRLNIHSCMR